MLPKSHSKVESPAGMASEMGRCAETTAPLSDTTDQATQLEPALRWVFPTQETVRLNRGTTTIGRDATAEVTLNSDAVSRRHAEIHRRGSALELVDLLSSNGVFVNGVRQQRTQLHPGDVVRIADCVAILVHDEVEAARDTERLNGFRQLYDGIWGSRGLDRMLQAARRVALTKLPVLIVGESGTGKEAFARVVHEVSQRPGRLVALNCAALSESLFEAELFGHERGAFTGAHRERPGQVQEAHRGTLFLDEVAELTLATQAKLLRVLQEGEVHPVGAREPIPVDVRIVTATHRDLSARVADGSFRLDLHQRLLGVTLELPPLRARREDILPLFRAFVAERLSNDVALSERLVEALCVYPWPGNVRELQRVARAMAALHSDLPRWRRSQLPKELRLVTPNGALAPSEAPPASTRVRPSELATESIIQALRAAGGNVADAARRLGIARQSLYTQLRERRIAHERHSRDPSDR